MSDFADNETLKTRGGERDQMTKDALLLADFLHRSGCVKRVGIAGSLSRGKADPTDIDLIIFVDDKKAIDCINEGIYLREFGKPVNIEKYLGFDDTLKTMFAITLTQMHDYHIDFQIISDTPSEEYVGIMVKNSVDPNFLQNISRDVLIFDPVTYSFHRQEVFTPEQDKIIEGAVFNRLKQMVTTGDSASLKYMEESSSHRKRIRDAKIQPLSPSK